MGKIVIEGCYTDAKGWIRRVDEHGQPQVWCNGGWVNCPHLGDWPHTPCPDPSLLELRPLDDAARRWMVDRPFRELWGNKRSRWRWNNKLWIFEYMTVDGRWAFASLAMSDATPVYPATGSWDDPPTAAPASGDPELEPAPAPSPEKEWRDWQEALLWACEHLGEVMEFEEVDGEYGHSPRKCVEVSGSGIYVVPAGVATKHWPWPWPKRRARPRDRDWDESGRT